LSNEEISFPNDIFDGSSISYDLFYSKSITGFQAWSKANGAKETHNGLGMLIEQAALSYNIWNSFKPKTKGLGKALGF
jgi:shikimate dehydrogenase